MVKNYKLRWRIEDIVKNLADNQHDEFNMYSLLNELPDESENEIWNIIFDIARDTPNKIYVQFDFRCPIHKDFDSGNVETLKFNNGQMVVVGLVDRFCGECKGNYKPNIDTIFVRLKINDDYIKYLQGRKSP